jgi:Raf kinase inhibitor-like YbhB/YbcL family protein
MRLTSETFAEGGYLPDETAFGLLGPGRRYVWGPNRNPQLAWHELPAGTRSLALVNDDLDVPTRLENFNREGAVVAADLARRPLCHWVLVDLDPAGPPIALGEFSEGVTAGGKPGPAAPRGARQGLNEYTGWFATDATMKGDYFGYDGPCPPWNDERPHRYVFTLYALDILLGDRGPLTRRDLEVAMQGHVLGKAELVGTYERGR